jgi:ubiquinone/menaquinone biosynthesis C-methylase UbiE
MRKDVIEFGCGIGTDAINFMRVGANYLGIDLSPRSVQIANQRCKVFGFAQSCHVHNMEEEIPHVSTKFDLVYSFGVLHHTPHPQLALERMRNVIARDGELRIMLYATNSWKKMMINAGLDQYEAQYGCPVVYTYHPDEIYELLSPEWRVNSIEQTHIFPYIVEDYKKLSYVKQPYFSAMNEKMFATLEKNLGWHLLIKATPK